MPWPVEEAKAIAARSAGRVEGFLTALYPHIQATAISRSVRSSHGFLANLFRVISLEVRETHDYISYWARQYFPDTAEEEHTLHHGSIWGIDRRPATKAIGKLDVFGTAGTAILENLVFVDGTGNRFTNAAAGIIAANNQATITVEAENPGTSGNLEAGIELELLEPIAGIDTITVEAAGIAGGAEEESPEEHRKAIIAHIRQRPHGGAGFDYPTWLSRQFDVRAVGVKPDWIGRGSVGVVAVMKDGLFGRAPTASELEAMAIYLGRPGQNEGVRPVTAHIAMVAGTIQEVPLTIRLRPNTAETQAAVAEAWDRFIATLGDEDDTGNQSPIGAKLECSRIIEAISGAAGEYAHDLVSPAASVQLGPDRLCKAWSYHL